jgi:hypothetical protein
VFVSKEPSVAKNTCRRAPRELRDYLGDRQQLFGKIARQSSKITAQGGVGPRKSRIERRAASALPFE